MKYILYAHNGSENHGCEAIVRSAVKHIGKDSYTVLLPYNPEGDYKYKTNEVVSEMAQYYLYGSFSPNRFIKVFMEKILGDKDFRYKIFLKNARKHLKSGNIAISVGGDNYCYEAFPETLASYNRIFHSYGMKTVLFGASIEPDSLSDINMQNDMNLYNLITARESITYNALLEHGIKTQVKLIPDTAFVLDKIEKPLPEKFLENNTVGINLSPRVGLCGPNHEKCFESYCRLIEYILNSTDMNIALIPHVVIKTSDDRMVLKQFYDKYRDSNRIFMIDDCNCEELKGYISRCRFVVAARTHCSIAAYSTCVPTLVVGYSVKSKGIAKDLFGTYEDYVIPVETIESETKLVDSFKWLEKNESKIKQYLNKKIPEYIKPISEIYDLLHSI